MAFVDQLSPDDIVQLAHVVSPLLDHERIGAGLIQDVWPNYLSLFRQQLHTTSLVDGDLIVWNNTNTRWEAGTRAPVDATYVVMSANATLTTERVLTAGTNITIVDGGANGAVTISAAAAAPVDATYVTLSNNATLTAERVLTAGTNITIVDGGANGTVTISVTASSVGVTTLNSNSGSNTNVAAGETDLMTYAMPGATLANNNDAVRLVAWGTTAANGNSKTIKVKFGATVILDTSVTTAAPNALDWHIECVVIRIGATTQDSDGMYTFSSNNENGAKRAAPAETLSGSVTIKLTGTGGLSGDITQEGMIIEKLPAA